MMLTACCRILYISVGLLRVPFFLWDAYVHQQFWRFSSVLCAMSMALDLFVFRESQASADELTLLMSVTKSTNWSMVSIANNRRPKVWRCLSSHFPR